MKRIVALPVLAAVAAAVVAAAGGASSGQDLQLTHVKNANVKAPGYAPASQLSGELHQLVVAQGSLSVENPDGIVTNYGYENDLPSVGNPAVPQMLPTPAVANEAQKTEPDKNTYLRFKDGLQGADDNYDYGTHFLFQGHELGAKVNGVAQSYITRINLDADTAHRVTVLATKDANGQPIQPIDGSTWDPWAKKLLFTTENASAPTYAATPDYPSTVTDVSGALGRGGYEGIQDDSDGNIWIVEDIGGSPTKSGTAKPPNSFIYRYVPAKPGDLENGKLQVLQVSNSHGDPITFESQAALNAADQVELHSYGKGLKTRWITIHDTAVNGKAPFNATTAAKAAHGTPFKRPENGVFRPGSNFTEFYFTETGDTTIASPEAANGGWGGVFKLVQLDPSADEGRISVFYKSDKAHTGLDNIQFLSQDQLGVVEDAGDGLHTDRNALDSGYVLEVASDYSKAKSKVVRWLAEGRDASATIDSAFSFSKNEGDNEITGLHVSDGDPTADGVLGAKIPRLERPNTKWRWFYTAQHGDNVTYEVVYDGPRGDSSDD